MSTTQDEIICTGYVLPPNVGESPQNPITEDHINTMLGLTAEQIKENDEQAVLEQRAEEEAQKTFEQDEEAIRTKNAASSSFVDMEAACDDNDGDADNADNADVDSDGNIRGIINDTPEASEQPVVKRLTRKEARKRVYKAYRDCHKLTFHRLGEDPFENRITALKLISQRKMKLQKRRSKKPTTKSTWLNAQIRSSSVPKALRYLRRKEERARMLERCRRARAEFEKHETPEARALRIRSAIAKLTEERKAYIIRKVLRY